MEVTGLKWLTYVGPSSCVTPANDPILMSYAELLSQVCVCMYICTYVCAYVCVHVDVNICVCVSVYVYVCMYCVYMRIF